MTVRTRFAPSPTGALHIGGARTALFNYLFAKRNGGQFILRIEDTDVARSDKGFEPTIVEGLRWLGLTWDEGPDCGGSFGPYRQSERLDVYERHFSALLDAGKIYPCFCTPEELKSERAGQEQRGEPPVYSGKCRDLTKTERVARQVEGRKPVYRFRTEPDMVAFTDLIRGPIAFATASFGDFSVAKGPREPLYNFAVVIDDATMAISHVIRGEEHLSNTPKQILLLQALGLPLPQYAHVPLLLGENKKKLSKRDADTALLDYRDHGYLPEAMLTFLALLGWNPKDEREVFSLQQLIAAFGLEGVQKSGAVFDVKKLASINGRMLRAMPVEDLIAHAGTSLERVGERFGEKLPDAVSLVQDRVTTLNDIAPSLGFLVEVPAYDASLLVPKKGSVERTKAALHLLAALLRSYGGAVTEKALEEAVQAMLVKEGFSNAEALWPFRIAVTGQQNSPPGLAVVAVLGLEETLRRIEAADKKL